jgi:hypothetical protein
LSSGKLSAWAIANDIVSSQSWGTDNRGIASSLEDV